MWRKDGDGRCSSTVSWQSDTSDTPVTGTLPTAWTPGSRRSGGLGRSASLSAAVASRRGIQRKAGGRGEAGARLAAPGHSRKSEGSRWRKPLRDRVRQSTIVTWRVIKLLSHVANIMGNAANWNIPFCWYNKTKKVEAGRYRSTKPQRFHQNHREWNRRHRDPVLIIWQYKHLLY